MVLHWQDTRNNMNYTSPLNLMNCGIRNLKKLKIYLILSKLSTEVMLVGIGVLFELKTNKQTKICMCAEKCRPESEDL